MNNFYKTLASIASPGGVKGKLQIFIFHRVLDKPDVFSMGEPDIKRFDRLLNILSGSFNILSIGEAVERISSSTLPARAACITFDDGYLDNYTNAFPILKKYNLPATIFIATDYIGRGIMWNDIVIESIKSFTGKLDLPELDIDNEECTTDNQRIRIIMDILPKIKHLPQQERESYVSQIESITGYKRAQLMMNPDEIIELHNHGITIGAHTGSHPILANLSFEESMYEISESKKILEELLNETIDYFAYPNGKPGSDYTGKDVEIVKKLGFKAAVSTQLSIATKNDNIYELPRFTPWDQNMIKFMVRSCYEMYKKRV